MQPLVTPIDSPYDPLVGRMDPLVDAYRVGCGYANGKEMLGYYTMGQTSFLLFIVVVVAILVCLAWRVADEEKTERRTAEEWLKRDALKAFEMRQTLIERFGSPGSSVRPEGSATWIFFGVTAALTFTLLGMCYSFCLVLVFSISVQFRDICISSIAILSTFCVLCDHARMAQLVCAAAEQHRHPVDYSESVDHPHEHTDSAFELLWSVVGPVQAQLPPCRVLDAGMSCWFCVSCLLLPL